MLSDTNKQSKLKIFRVENIRDLRNKYIKIVFTFAVIFCFDRTHSLVSCNVTTIFIKKFDFSTLLLFPLIMLSIHFPRTIHYFKYIRNNFKCIRTLSRSFIGFSSCLPTFLQKLVYYDAAVE